MNIRFYPPREGLTYEEIRRGDIWLYADVRCPHCGDDVAVSNTHYVGGPCPKCGGLTSGASSCPVVRPQGGDTNAPTELDRAYFEVELERAAPTGLTGTTERMDVV